MRTLILGNLRLAAKQILENHKLSDQQTWENLINIYQCNPPWIEFTASMIQELFLQTLFCSRKLAGKYKTESENYQIFFQLSAEINHQS